MRRSITLRYSVQQAAYWAAAAGVMSFASAYLLAKGLSASLVGTLLALGSLLSCAVQPLLADRADRLGAGKIKYMIAVLSVLCMVFFGALLLIPRGGAMGVIYLLGIFSFDAMMPLLNAVSVSCNSSGLKINYGVGRGIGSVAYAFAALGLGRLIADYGEDRMIWAIELLLLANIIISLGYPAIKGGGAGERTGQNRCSVVAFFNHYRRYCFSLLGVLLLGAFHAMTENYLIKIFDRLGGGSAEVGAALFVATVVESLVLLFYEPIRRRIPEGWLLKIAGISFLLKAFLFMAVDNVEGIYLVQLLQATSYSFLAPTQVFYAEKKVLPADMVKGQAFITAAYSLGCAGGSFAGGLLIQNLGVDAMLWAGTVMAALGTGVFFISVNRTDNCLSDNN